MELNLCEYYDAEKEGLILLEDLAEKGYHLTFP